MFGIAALIGAWCMFAPAAQSASPKPATLPAAGPVAVPTTIARVQPSDARRVTVLHEVRPDFRTQYVWRLQDGETRTEF
jgi:hypothetical protein